MNYNLLRPLLFSLNPELSHNLSLKAIDLLAHIHLLKPFLKKIPSTPKKVFGLTFPNAIGLAAGLDKNGDHIDALGALGFGFIEVGTVTPKPQAGNPKPRLFRLTHSQAIINRMGFNNKGVDYLLEKIMRKTYQGILGINIGKNATTPIENALSDYLIAMQKVYYYADYITVNISSPNTPRLRDLQGSEYFNNLLVGLKLEQSKLADKYNRVVPLLIKIAPDVTSTDITEMATAIIENKIDGVIVTNTAIDRFDIHHEKFANESGGLSGMPLFEKATHVLKQFKAALSGHGIPLIGSGGIMSPEQAILKMEAGADLIQLYTGLIYHGPNLIAACAQALREQQRTQE